MGELIAEYSAYDAFARRWHADTLTDRGISLDEARERGLINEQETRHLWQLLGLLPDGDLFIQLPEWLAEEKIEVTDTATPTVFVGRIARETDDAIRFEGSAAARPLMRLAHRIHSLEHGLANRGAEDDRRDWLESRVRETRREFDDRDGLPGLADEWLPKSQLITAVRRCD